MEDGPRLRMKYNTTHNIILFIAVSIKNIVDMSGNKQFVKTRACMSFITRTAAALRQLTYRYSALWRECRQLNRRRCFINQSILLPS